MLPKLKKLLFEVEFQHSDSPYQNKTVDIYLTKFQELRQSIIANLQEFIPVDVVVRQPPPHLIPTNNKLNKRAYFDSKKNKVVEFPRKNSFEVYVDHFHLFSRLESGAWPDVSGICEWALRVAEKMVDFEIEKEEDPFNEKTRNIKEDKDDAVQHAIKSERLPPVSRGFDRTLRNRPDRGTPMNIYHRSRYPSLREDDQMPYGIDPMNETLNKKMPLFGMAVKMRKKVNSIDKQIKTIPRGSRSQSRDQSFHWHLKRKTSNKKVANQIRYSDFLSNTIDIPAKQSIELSPLPAVNEKATEQRKDEEIKQSEVDKVELKLSISNLNCFRSHYKIEGNKIIKTEYEEVWSPILCENPLPMIGEYYLHLIIRASKNNQIQFGIAPLTYYPRLDRTERPDCLLSYNCGNGTIKDAKHNFFATETCWREGGRQVTEQPSFHFIALINMNTRVIEWHINQKIVASAKIPSQFSNGFRAFISLYNCKDVVLLNEKVHRFQQDKTPQQADLWKANSERRQVVGVSVQTGDNTQETALPILQNRIYANAKLKDSLLPKIDEITQTTQAFEGRIKKQRLQRLIQKNHSEKQKEKEKASVFTRQDIQVLKQANIQQQKQIIYPKVSIIREYQLKNQEPFPEKQMIPTPINDSKQLQTKKNETKVEETIFIKEQSKSFEQQQLPKNEEVEVNHIEQGVNQNSQLTKISLVQAVLLQPIPVQQPHSVQQPISVQDETILPQVINANEIIEPQIINIPINQNPKVEPMIQQHEKDESEAQQTIQWFGVYEQATFKLKDNRQIAQQ